MSVLAVIALPSALLVDRHRTIPSLPIPGQAGAPIVPSTVDTVERATADSIFEADIRPTSALVEFGKALAALRAESGAEDFDAAATLLQKYCRNAAENLEDDRVRRIRCSNAAFQKISRFGSGEKCLAAVGFVRETTAEGTAQLVLPRAAERLPLSAAASRLQGELRMRAVQRQWPEALRAALPTAASTFALRPELLEALTAELRHPHVPALLQHKDNVGRVTEQLVQSVDSADRLLAQLREVRQNVTAAAKQQQQQAQAKAASGSAAGGATPAAPAAKAAKAKGRVVKVHTPEEWYDLLLEAPGLVVAYFGAAWCKPCQVVKPLFAAMSALPKFASVTFVQVDADELGGICSECEVRSLPTFKFFRDSAEDELPIVGADALALEDRISEMIA